MSKEEEEEIIIPIPAEYQEALKDLAISNKKFAKRHEYWKENIRPKWKAIKKTQSLIDDFLTQPANNITISYDDILNSFVKTGNTLRSKIKTNNTKVKVDDYGGLTYAQAMKFLDALAMYNKYRAEPNKLKSPQAMQSVLRSKRFPWTLATLKRYLTIARKLPPDLGAVKTRRKKLQNL